MNPLLFLLPIRKTPIRKHLPRFKPQDLEHLRQGGYLLAKIKGEIFEVRKAFPTV